MALVAALLALGAVTAAFAAGDNGQAIGQDPLRLALTQCSNAGGGNGGEFEAALLGRVATSECLEKRLGSRYSAAEIAAILAQSNCTPIVIAGRYSFLCEIDPGNSADHNQAG